MTTTEAEGSIVANQPRRLMFRSEEPGDRSYILSCWDNGWADAPENRDLIHPEELRLLERSAIDEHDLKRQAAFVTSRKYRRKFQELVAGGDGVLWRPTTRVLVGCQPEKRASIWSFCVFTPATEESPPVIHWLTVRPNHRGDDGSKVPLRRRRIATLMLACGDDGTGRDIGPGLRPRRGGLTPMLYTCRPGRQRSLDTGDQWELWGALVSALYNIGIKAEYIPLETWLARGGR